MSTVRWILRSSEHDEPSCPAPVTGAAPLEAFSRGPGLTAGPSAVPGVFVARLSRPICPTVATNRYGERHVADEGTGGPDPGQGAPGGAHGGAPRVGVGPAARRDHPAHARPPQVRLPGRGRVHRLPHRL